MEKILYLTLKKKWFDMVASGEKKEEYREIKKYWGKRLLVKVQVPYGGYLSPWKDIENGDFNFNQWRVFAGSPFEKFDSIIFTNGYNKNAPKIKVEFEHIKISDNGKTEWGFEKRCFVIALGKILTPIQQGYLYLC